MVYAPNVSPQNAPLSGAASFWSNIVANHAELYGIQPPLAEVGRSNTYGQPTTDLKAWRFRVRGNRDQQDVRCRVRASGTGSPTVTLWLDGESSGAVTVAADAWYDMTVTGPNPGNVHDAYVEVDVPAGVGNTMTISRLLAYIVDPVGPTDTDPMRPSGYRNGGGLASPNWPVTVEYVERLRDAPVHMARERPVCVFCHMAPCLEIGVSTSASDFGRWCAEDIAYAKLVGRGLLPSLTDDQPRRYVIDAFVSAGAGGDVPEAVLQVGSYAWPIPAVNSWQSVEVVLPHGPLDVLATLNPGASTIAQFDAVQIWRL